MKRWPTSAKVFFWFVASMLGFTVLRLLLPEPLLFLTAAPGALFLGHVVNLAVAQSRKPPAGKADGQEPPA
ncbi:hypothetical protein [Pseudarthrobacter sp. NPDC127529]|uniref:hypothetical protein n=1 Tax=Pseudarthrobacter sp. NPDC127529 TaxID=3345396 RepID=UPI003641FAA1